MATPELIVSIEDVRERMSLPNVPEINDAIERGLNACHVAFAAVLGSAFEATASLVDIFYLNEDLHALRPNNLFRLRLRQAFVKPGSVSLIYADTRKGLTDSPTAFPVADYQLDLNKGLVFIDDVSSINTLTTAWQSDSYRNKYVQVTYTAGFKTAALDTGVLPPDWLVEAVKAWMPSVLFNKADDIAKQMQVALEVRRQALIMIEPYKRETAFNFHPIF